MRRQVRAAKEARSLATWSASTETSKQTPIFVLVDIKCFRSKKKLWEINALVMLISQQFILSFNYKFRSKLAYAMFRRISLWFTVSLDLMFFGKWHEIRSALCCNSKFRKPKAPWKRRDRWREESPINRYWFPNHRRNRNHASKSWSAIQINIYNCCLCLICREKWVYVSTKRFLVSYYSWLITNLTQN